jgi:hypothetical protein
MEYTHGNSMDTNLARKPFATDRYAVLTGVEILEAGP